MPDKFFSDPDRIIYHEPSQYYPKQSLNYVERSPSGPYFSLPLAGPYIPPPVGSGLSWGNCFQPLAMGYYGPQPAPYFQQISPHSPELFIVDPSYTARHAQTEYIEAHGGAGQIVNLQFQYPDSISMDSFGYYNSYQQQQLGLSGEGDGNQFEADVKSGHAKREMRHEKL